MDTDGHLLTERRGRLGLVTLNHPAALNALSRPMVMALRAALDLWADDPTITAVAIQGAGGRAFCAGGDIRELYEQLRAGEIDEARSFWALEYDLNRVIKRYPKPYVALIDGIVMGGGVGVSLHGSHRVAGPGMSFAMPEVGIGFFPDVGATHALPRLPGAAGTWLALTGARIGAGDGLALGLATHGVAAGSFPAIVAALSDGMAPDEAIGAHRTAHDTGPALAERALIDRCFAGATVEAIVEALDEAAADDSAFARHARDMLQQKSPTSLKIALRQMQVGRTLTFEDAMRLEYRIASRIIRGHEFLEGVRAAIIDKDRTPRWRPDSLADVTDAMVATYFAPLVDGDITFEGA